MRKGSSRCCREATPIMVGKKSTYTEAAHEYLDETLFLTPNNTLKAAAKIHRIRI